MVASLKPEAGVQSLERVAEEWGRERESMRRVVQETEKW